MDPPLLDEKGPKTPFSLEATGSARELRKGRMEVIVKIEKTNTMTNTWSETKTKIQSFVFHNAENGVINRKMAVDYAPVTN